MGKKKYTDYALLFKNVIIICKVTFGTFFSVLPLSCSANISEEMMAAMEERIKAKTKDLLRDNNTTTQRKMNHNIFLR